MNENHIFLKNKTNTCFVFVPYYLSTVSALSSLKKGINLQKFATKNHDKQLSIQC